MRQALQRLEELAALPPEGQPDGDAGKQLAGFLAVVANRTAVALTRRPDMRPFFAVSPLVESCIGGSYGDQSRIHTISPGYTRVAEAPPRSVVGRSGRAPYQQARPRRLTPVERDAVHALALYRTLRELATEFGASHETIRSVLRASPSATRR